MNVASAVFDTSSEMTRANARGVALLLTEAYAETIDPTANVATPSMLAAMIESSFSTVSCSILGKTDHGRRDDLPSQRQMPRAPPTGRTSAAGSKAAAQPSVQKPNFASHQCLPNTGSFCDGTSRYDCISALGSRYCSATEEEPGVALPEALRMTYGHAPTMQWQSGFRCDRLCIHQHRCRQGACSEARLRCAARPSGGN